MCTGFITAAPAEWKLSPKIRQMTWGHDCFLGPGLFLVVARPAMPLWQVGTHYLLISLIILTTHFCLVLNAASKRIFTNFHPWPSHKQCPCLQFISLNWHMVHHQQTPAAWLIDWLIRYIQIWTVHDVTLKALQRSLTCTQQSILAAKLVWKPHHQSWGHQWWM